MLICFYMYISLLSQKTFYVSHFALSFYCMNGSIEGRCTNYKNSSVCNSEFIARSVLLEIFKVMCLLFIDPFMQQSEKRIMWHIGGFFVITTIYKRSDDTGRSFDPIFMKFTWLVWVHSWVNPIVFGNNSPNRTANMGEMCPQNWFFGFKSNGMGFLRKKLKNCIWYPIYQKKGCINFCRPSSRSLKNGDAPQK